MIFILNIQFSHKSSDVIFDNTQFESNVINQPINMLVYDMLLSIN